MKNNIVKQLLDNTDIYLIDQILKDRFHSSEIILDAGCGSGRNLHWFYNNDFEIYGIDQNETQYRRLEKEVFQTERSLFSFIT